jgi:hypothetical protein
MNKAMGTPRKFIACRGFDVGLYIEMKIYYY